LTKRPILRVIIYPFKVIFSPLKAFREIVQSPDFKGVLLILGLILLTTVAAYLAYSSKVFLGLSERPSVPPRLHTFPDAYVYETAFGNYTFESNQPYIMNYTFFDKTPLIERSFFWVNTTKLLTPTTPQIVKSNETFYQVNVKWNQSTTEVGNLTLTFKFFSDKSPTISTLFVKTAQWDLENLTDFSIHWFIRSPYTYWANGTTAVDLTSEATLSLLETDAVVAELGYTAFPNNWMNSILIDWSNNDNATVYGGHDTPLIDSGPWLDIVFKENDSQIEATTVGLTYSRFLTTNRFIPYLIQTLTGTAISFLLQWVIYAGILLLVMRAFREKGGSWHPFFVVVGYAFSVMIIQWAVSAVLIATLPETHLQNQIETWWFHTSYQAFVYLVSPILNFIDIWVVMLSVVVVHTFSETAWGKAFMIATTAFVINLLVRLFLTVGGF